MKIITIVRHAKSSWSQSGLTDKERPLNKRGERDAPVMGRRISEHDIRPSLICSSPAVRAWTTAKYVANVLNYPLEFMQREDQLYLGSVNDILEVLAVQDSGFNSIMLFGHNPGFTDFANFLQPGITNNLPTAGVVSVQFDQEDWNLFEQPQTELLVHDYPKLHRD